LARIPKHIFPAAAVVFLFCFCGCATLFKAAVPASGLNASRLIASVKQRRDEVISFKGIGRLEIAADGNKQTTRMVWIGARPKKLRIEIFGAPGQPAVTILINGSTFYLYEHQDNRCFQGKATEANLSRFVSLPLSAEDLICLLSGQPPIVPFHHASIKAENQQGDCLLRLYGKWRRLVEKIWLTDKGRCTERFQLFDRWGNLKYTATFSRFQVMEGVCFPQKIIISHVQGKTLSLDVERFWTAIPIPDDAFTLELSDTEVVDLDS